MDDFNTEHDVMFLRQSEDGGSPFEYLYFHVEDKDGANFAAYFDNLSCNEPTVYRLDKITINGLTKLSSITDDFVKTILRKDKEDTEKVQPWEQIKKPDMITAGIWKNLLKLIKEEILNSQNNEQ